MINVSGALLPFLVWLVLIISSPKAVSPLVLWTRFIATTCTLCSLLAWVVIPILYLMNAAPAGDDVTAFLANSGLPAVSVAFAALVLFLGGWFLFVRHFPGTRPVWNALLDRVTRPVPVWHWLLGGGVILTALVGAGLLVTSTLGNGLRQVPKGYNLAASIDLSSRDRLAETIAGFDLPGAGDAAIFLSVVGIDASFIDVTLVPSQGIPLQLLHGEDFVSNSSDTQNQYRLPAGHYNIVLTSRNSSGNLEVYFRIP